MSDSEQTPPLTAPAHVAGIDREAFQDYLGSFEAPLEPAFDRRAVNVTGSTTENGTTALELSELNMTSLGAVANQTVEVRKGSPDGEVVASAAVTGEPAKDASGQVGGAASLEVRVADLEGESAYLVVSPAGTTMQLPAELFAAGDSEPTPEPTPEPTDRPTFGQGRDLADQRKADRQRPSGDLREWVLEQRERRSGR